MTSKTILGLPLVGISITLIFGFLFISTEYELNKYGLNLYESDPVLFLTFLFMMCFGVIIYITGIINYKVQKIHDRLYPQESKKKLSKKQNIIANSIMVVFFGIVIYYMYEAGMYDNIIELFESVTSIDVGDQI